MSGEGEKRQAIEWRPSDATARTWALVSLPVALVALVVYAAIASRGVPATGQLSGPALAGALVAVVVLYLAVSAFHEAVHAAVMLGMGIHPTFGTMLIGGFLPAFYTTAPGRLFGRRRYLAVGFAPTVVVSLVGVAACLLPAPAGGLCVVPFALHLGGCVGDVGIMREVLRQPRDVRCEDLRDGVRFVPPDAL